MTRPNIGDLFPIGAEGDAQPEDVRSGSTFSNEDETGIAGTMPNRSGHVTAQSRVRSGTTLRFRPQPGYYDGSTANSVQFSDGQFVAGNILKGRSIFGLTGSAEAKRLGWNLVTSTGAFGTRSYGQAIVYDQKLWFMGGFSNDTTLPRSVWYTTNGTSWTQATGGATWGSRSGYSVEVYDNKMWVYGGSGPGNAPMYNDVWYTTNGSAWTQVYESADWPGRANGASAVFDDGLWLMAGWEGSYRRDIWYGNIRSDGMIY